VTAHPDGLRVLDRPLVPREADAVAAWRYEAPFDLYDGSARDVFLHPDYRPVYDGDDLVGFVCFGAEARILGQEHEDGVVDVGAGLRPDLLGQRVGTALMPLVVEFAREQLGAQRIRAVVAQFNTRSQRVGRSAGFQPVRTFDGPGGQKFVELVLEV